MRDADDQQAQLLACPCVFFVRPTTDGRQSPRERSDGCPAVGTGKKDHAQASTRKRLTARPTRGTLAVPDQAVPQPKGNNMNGNYFYVHYIWQGEVHRVDVPNGESVAAVQLAARLRREGWSGVEVVRASNGAVVA